MSNDDIILCKVNGKEEPLPAGLTVASFLEKKNVNPKLVAVEINNQIIDRDKFAVTNIQENDTVEYLYFMGGGVV